MFAGPGANARELAMLDALEGAVKGLRMLPPPALAREPRERRFGRGRQGCEETRGIVRGRSIGGTRRHDRARKSIAAARIVLRSSMQAVIRLTLRGPEHSRSATDSTPQAPRPSSKGRSSTAADVR